MASERKLVGLLASNAVLRGHIFRRKAHAQVGVRIVVHQPGIRGNLIAAHRNHGHGFGAAGENDVAVSRHDSLGGHGDGLQARRTKSINRDCGNFNGQTRPQRSIARHVHSRFCLRHRAAQDHILYVFGVEARDAPDRILNRDGREIVGPRRA